MKQIILIILFTLSNIALAQRPGAMEIGGSFYFTNSATSEATTKNVATLQSFVGYHFNKKFLMEFEPSLNLSFTNDESSIGLNFLVTPNIILTDLAPMDARRRRDPASMMATSATICAGVGGGVWIEGTSGYGYEQNDHAGGALTAGISTRTNLGRTTLIRAKAQFIYLLPSGSVFTEARSIFQIGVGFGVFVRY